MEDFAKHGGWTTVTNQVAPLGAPDYSSYLLNVANSRRRIPFNVNWGHDAVLSIKQAKQFGIFDKMKLVIPYQMPFLSQEVGAGRHAGRLRRHRFLVDARRQVSRWPRCSSTPSEKKYGYSPEWGANNAYMQFAMWADAVERRRQLLSARRDQGVRGGRTRAVDGRATCISAPRITSSCAR